ncbi:MAG: glycosyltransferase [Opitutus sp.]|nr:glycosyltransferase [Opitutus sp.]MCS6274339.1 glycosyltransferase [Opitutus sp.]MCS6277670.1 glycosyltransferase [Opitutus sp.]MCS6300788.1 glycosyltransferase [Opitutus sp.]
MKIGIITPSYNQGRYLEATIKSIIEQSRPVDYYAIYDSCSTDETAEVLAKYKNHPLVSKIVIEKDRGQADALNRGFAEMPADIDVMAYLNSDDLLLSGALNQVFQAFCKNPDVSIISGERYIIGRRGRLVMHQRIIPMVGSDAYSGISLFQEATFWKSNLYRSAGGFIDLSYRFAMDYDLFLRMMRVGWSMHYINSPLGAFRVHELSKTSSMLNNLGLKEINELRQRYGYSKLSFGDWVEGARGIRLKHYGIWGLFKHRLQALLLRFLVLRVYA